MLKYITQRMCRLALLTICLFAVTGTQADNIKDIDISVVIDSDGTAQICEKWTVDIDKDDEYTEWNIFLHNFGNMKISDFRLHDADQNKDYTNEGEWNIERTRAEKAGKCGWVTNEGNDKELCWGIGTTGLHHWEAYYTVTGFVKKYKDGCGFNHCFVNHDMSSAPEHARTCISRADGTPYDAQNAKIWAFNYKGGTINFKDGKIVAETKNPMTTDEAMTIMCIFPANAYASANVVNDTIGTMRDKALDGSDYVYGDNEEDDSLTFGVIIFVIILFAISIVLMFLGWWLMMAILYGGALLLWYTISLKPLRVWWKRHKLSEGYIGEFTNKLPINGNLHRAFAILDECSYSLSWSLSKDNLISAYMVRLMRMGAITITTVETKGKRQALMKIEDGFFKEDKWKDQEASYKAEKAKKNSTIEYLDYDELSLYLIYHILYDAAGENHIIEKDEILKNTKKDSAQLEELKEILDIDEDPATPEEYQQLLALKKYLKEFGSTDILKAEDVTVWDEYMVYATLFGNSQELIKSLKEYNPEYFKASVLSQNNNLDYLNDHYFSTYSFSSIVNDFNSLTQSSGSSSYSGGGGYSSSGGGGGCSGGGGGGGGR